MCTFDPSTQPLITQSGNHSDQEPIYTYIQLKVPRPYTLSTCLTDPLKLHSQTMGSAASKPASTSSTPNLTPISTVKYDEKRPAACISNMTAMSSVNRARNHDDDGRAGTTETGLTRSKLDAWQEDFDAVSDPYHTRLPFHPPSSPLLQAARSTCSLLPTDPDA